MHYGLVWLAFMTYQTLLVIKCQILFIHISSSSSYRAGSTDIPDPLSPLLPIVHRPR